MTAAELRKAENRYQRASTRAGAMIRDAQAERTAAIRAACESMPQREVAAVLGISHGRVAQIVGGERKP